MALQDSKFYADNVPDYTQKSFAAQMYRLGPAGTAPLFGFTSQLPRKTASDVEHGYFTKTAVFPYVTADGAILAAVTTLVVDDTTNTIAGDLLRVQSTGEIVRVTTVDSATQLTIKRGFGQIAAATIPDNAYLYNVGNAFEQASNAPGSRLMNPARVINFTQIFRNAWALPRTVKAMRTIVGSGHIAESRLDCSFFHSGDIEKAMFWGQKYSGYVNNQYITAMDGLIESVRRLAPAGNTSVASSTTSYTQLETMLNPCFDTRVEGMEGNDRILFVGGAARTVINNIGRLSGQYQIVDGQGQFGLQFSAFRTSRGMFRMIEHPLFNTNADWKKMAVAVCLPAISLPYLDDTMLTEYGMNGQYVQDGKDAVGGVMTTELTMENINPAAHAVVYGLTAAAA